MKPLAPLSRLLVPAQRGGDQREELLHAGTLQSSEAEGLCIQLPSLNPLTPKGEGVKTRTVQQHGGSEEVSGACGGGIGWLGAQSVGGVLNSNDQMKESHS